MVVTDRVRSDELSVAVGKLDRILEGLTEKEIVELNLPELLSAKVVMDYGSELISMSKITQRECEADAGMLKLENELTWFAQPSMLDAIENELGLSDERKKRAGIAAYFDILKYHKEDADERFYLLMIKSRYRISAADLKERGETEYKREFIKGRYDLARRIAADCELGEAKISLASTMMEVKAYITLQRNDAGSCNPL